MVADRNNLPHDNAAGFMIMAQIANDALFNCFRIPPPYEVNASTKRSLVIWGTVTSVGMAMNQLARVSRIGSIIVTASPKRHDYLKTLDATHCFNYSGQGTVESIQTIFREADDGPIWGLNAIQTVSIPDSQTLLARSIPKANKDKPDIYLATFRGLHGWTTFGPCFNLRNGQRLEIPARLDESDRMWKALAWKFEHFGEEYQAPLLRVFKCTAIKELENSKAAGKGVFGKLVLAHPWEREECCVNGSVSWTSVRQVTRLSDPKPNASIATIK
ncbi:Zinc-type alcohol dehydrogenase-like protein C2E1P3.01-like protein 3 [Colletotrichum chlorophyti]|uniref:Zinc-type alcohol dehydrogenase-like protein C2E1P3.01-like protein 3 n=1 Tax=Colletotrichum chlorophyti TaxID=708187 RepID=A0A1Q8RR28_9PEZI|nr:Zinc-type alcohol dehydrogenase-like protein C2E1P3.01-like protein 3 [Colletotrichum chlorophyti]